MLAKQNSELAIQRGNWTLSGYMSATVLGAHRNFRRGGQAQKKAPKRIKKAPKRIKKGLHMEKSAPNCRKK